MPKVAGLSRGRRHSAPRPPTWPVLLGVCRERQGRHVARVLCSSAPGRARRARRDLTALPQDAAHIAGQQSSQEWGSGVTATPSSTQGHSQLTQARLGQTPAHHSPLPPFDDSCSQPLWENAHSWCPLLSPRWEKTRASLCCSDLRKTSQSDFNMTDSCLGLYGIRPPSTANIVGHPAAPWKGSQDTPGG